MEGSEQNGLVTVDGIKVLPVEEYDKFINSIPEAKRVIFEINTITGLRYVELQRLHANPQWYYKARNQIILPREAQLKVKQKAPKCTIDKLPSTFTYLFKLFLAGKQPPERTSWNKDLERWSLKAGISPKVNTRHLERALKAGCSSQGFLRLKFIQDKGMTP